MKRLILILPVLIFLKGCGSNTGEPIVVGPDKTKALELELKELESKFDELEEELTNVKEKTDTLTSDIGVIESKLERSIIEIVKPCATAKELILKFGSGELVAYYENNGKRFLTALSDGNYKTTDGTGCKFSIVDGEIEL